MSDSQASAPRAPALALCIIGIGLCVALQVVHVRTYALTGIDSVCSVGERFDCVAIAQSRFAVLLGVPLPVWGMASFAALAIASWRRSRLVVLGSLAAAIVSLFLLLEAIFNVGSLCLYCEGVHLCAFALLAYSVAYRRRLANASRVNALEMTLVPVVLLVTARVFTPQYWSLGSWQHRVPYATGVDTDGRPWVGAKTPVVVVHEYVDYMCPHCAIGTGRLRQRLADDPDSIRIVRHHQPRMRCQVREWSCQYARAAICGGDQDAFWRMDSWLFAHVPRTRTLDLEAAARDLGLDAAALQACMQREEVAARADADFSEAMARGITATPGYVVDGEALAPADVLPAIDRALAR